MSPKLKKYGPTKTISFYCSSKKNQLKLVVFEELFLGLTIFQVNNEKVNSPQSYSNQVPGLYGQVCQARAGMYSN
jgi:hypothetical protein